MNDTAHPTVSKRALIAEAALQTFANYGFQRTSMEDIARAAGVSRPALYQVFSNKADIFRALLEEGLAGCLEEMERQLSMPGLMADRLEKAFDLGIVEHYRTVASMAHGHEVTGLKNEIGADILTAWAVDLRAMFQRVFLRETNDEKLAGDFAVLVESAMSGIKARELAPDDMMVEFSALARSVGSAFR